MDFKTIFNDAVDALEKAAKDFTTLDVTTVTGDVNQIIDKNNKISVKSLLSELKEGNISGKIEVVAHTHVDFDQDATQFINKDLSSKKDLFLLHQNMVKSSIESRNAFIKFLKEVF